MKVKKAILTGGGRATRLRPITNTMNKHVIPLANKPMIFYAIENTVAAGIKEIFINVNPGEDSIQKTCGDGSRWGVEITYYEQTGGPLGIAHAVACAEKFIGSDPFLFYLSDNIVVGGIDKLVHNFVAAGEDCRLVFTPVPDPERSGVPLFDGSGKLLEIIEKPKNPPCNLAMTGIMLYGPKVFFEAFRNLSPSARGEYEISGINSYLIKRNYNVGHETIDWWKDAGVPYDLINTNSALLDKKASAEFRCEGRVAESVKITGSVYIGAGSIIAGNTILEGPAIIGENCTLENAVVGPHVTIGAGTTINNARLKRSIVLSNCTIDGKHYIENSVIAAGVKIKGQGHEKPMQLLLSEASLLEL